MIALTITVPAIADPVTDPVSTNVKYEQLEQRLMQIKNMSKENLTSSDKKELRKEVKGIKKEMRASKNGVYLSVGAIIIIALLLIILL